MEDEEKEHRGDPEKGGGGMIRGGRLAGEIRESENTGRK